MNMSTPTSEELTYPANYEPKLKQLVQGLA